jgi:Cactus-binding C-terminus of cactin protein
MHAARVQVQGAIEQVQAVEWATGAAAAAPRPTGDGAVDAEQVQQAQAAMGGVAGDDAFTALVPLEARQYWWREKHKPRRPKFFNKAHQGYDWNKYNRAHYDVDNPPPKVVQGYKFNIFYPDLIDPSHAPTYKLLDDPSGDDTTKMLMFMAGAPYEDIAFRIVNKDWDRGPKKGFKSVFDRGMLQLYFNFKRTPYKR